MKTSARPATPKGTSRAKCKICRKVPSHGVIEHFADESFPPAVYQLEQCEDIRRCPLCSTYYLMESGSDPHHFMSAETSITRISAERAFGQLALMLATRDHQYIDADKKKLWMGELDTRVSKLLGKLKTANAAKAAEAAATLAEIYFQRKDWGKIEALLRQKSLPFAAAP